MADRCICCHEVVPARCPQCSVWMAENAALRAELDQANADYAQARQEYAEMMVMRDAARLQRDELISVVGVPSDGESQDDRPSDQQWRDILVEITGPGWRAYLAHVEAKVRNEIGGEG